MRNFVINPCSFDWMHTGKIEERFHKNNEIFVKFTKEDNGDTY